MTYFMLGLYVWPLVEQTEKFEFDPPFFPCSEQVARSIRVFDDDSGIRGRSLVLL